MKYKVYKDQVEPDDTRYILAGVVFLLQEASVVQILYLLGLLATPINIPQEPDRNIHSWYEKSVIIEW